MQVSTLRPGLLVSLKTSVAGNVAYEKRELEAEHVDDNGTQIARWETTRTVIDPAEQERAKVARGRCRSIITAVCANSAFGLLCPESRADDLEAAITESRRIADAFNANATQTKIAVYIISGRVAQDDREAIRAINGEVRELLAAMASGIDRLDADAVREAANKARNIGSMLAADAQQRLQDAVDAVRTEARKMIKAGEQVAIDIDAHTLAALAVARTQFLDLEGDDRVKAPEAEARAADLEPSEEQIREAEESLAANTAAWDREADELAHAVDLAAAMAKVNAGVTATVAEYEAVADELRRQHTADLHDDDGGDDDGDFGSAPRHVQPALDLD